LEFAFLHPVKDASTLPAFLLQPMLMPVSGMMSFGTKQFVHHFPPSGVAAVSQQKLI
jgi:hypothetical protein